MEFRSEDFGLLRNFIRRAVKKPTWWVFKDKLLQARAQQLQKLKGMLQKAKVDGQGALGTAQTHKRSTQEHSRVWPLPEDAEEVLGKPKLGWNLWDMKDTKDTCSCRHNKEGWGKHGPGAQWGRRPSELGHGRGTECLFVLAFTGSAGCWPSRSARVCGSVTREDWAQRNVNEVVLMGCAWWCRRLVSVHCHSLLSDRLWQWTPCS